MLRDSILEHPMHNLALIEECYQRFSRQWPQLLPEGMLEINLKSLSDMGLINFQDSPENEEDMLTRYFHVVETREKITLINEEFIVWIVPDPNPTTQLTTIFVALNKQPLPPLEVGYLAQGVYNTLSLVLRFLERLLNDIHENEALIKAYQEAI